jgi:hypothetical protein
MQLYRGESYLPKTVQKLRQIPLRLLTHPGNLDAVEQRRSLCILAVAPYTADCFACRRTRSR